MTYDVVAIAQETPGLRPSLAAMIAAGPGLGVRQIAGGAVTQLCAGGQPLVSIEVPLLVSVPGEIERLLGGGIAAHVPLPAWWVELRAAETPQAAQIARRYAAELTRRLGGRVWSSAEPGPADELAGQLAGGAHPGVDALTGRAALVRQNRHLVPLTAWLTDAIRFCAESGRAFQLMTSGNPQLTWPLRLALLGRDRRWVVRADGGRHYDGTTGRELSFDGAAFTPSGQEGGMASLAEPFTHGPTPYTEGFVLTVATTYPAAEQTLVGGSVETLCRTLTGSPPAGWGTSEPAGQPWNRRRISELCRARAPGETTLVFAAGRSAAGLMTIGRGQAGVTESATIVTALSAGQEATAGKAAEAAAALLAADDAGALVSMLALRAFTSPGLAVAPRWMGIPGPIGFALGPAGVREAGLRRALTVPGVAARRLDESTGVWYDLGTGITEQSAQALQRLTAHLGSPIGGEAG